MTWPLREIPFPFDRPYDAIKPGECWRVPLDHQRGDALYEDIWRDRFSPQFLVTGRRFVWQIALPGGGHWSPDFRGTDGGDGWTLFGDSPETLTASPSINAVGSFHGWLQNGVLTDDCEGRTYLPPAPDLDEGGGA